MITLLLLAACEQNVPDKPIDDSDSPDTGDPDTGVQLYTTDGTLVHVGEDRSPEDFEGHSGDRSQPAPADFDGDGDMDLLLGDAYGYLTIFWNEGDDTFSPGEVVLEPRAESRAALSATDWDGDGDVDVLLGQYGGLWIHLNEGGAGELSLGPPEYIDTATIYYPHPYPGDINGDGDTDLVVSSSYYYVYVFERTMLEQGVLEASAVAIEDQTGRSEGYDDGGDGTFSYEADTPPSYAWPAWTPFSDEGTVASGIWTLGPDDGAYLGTIFSSDGNDDWEGGATTEVELTMRVIDLTEGDTDSLSVSVSDGSNNWHLRFDPAGISFYAHADRYTVDTLDWHTWRLAIDGATMTVCRDDDATETWSSAPSFTYARNALWIGDDGTGTSGTTEIDSVRWNFAGDGDPCTGW